MVSTAGDLTKQYEVPLPNVTRHSGRWPHTVTPSIDRTLHHVLTITDLDLITEFDFYLSVQGFHRTYATGAACQQRTLTPPDIWSCPTLGLACVLMSREKGRDLTQSYDKSPYTNRNVKRAKWQHKQRHKKVRLNRGCGPTKDGQSD